jgi:biopolymer transport protein ExbB
MARSLKNGIDASASQLQKGLTFLASTGATAPFIGLFGTVWGIYHALIAISSSGSAQIDQVAGPIGEALIMTVLRSPFLLFWVTTQLIAVTNS